MDFKGWALLLVAIALASMAIMGDLKNQETEERRAAREEKITTEFQAFKAVGPRFPLQYGMSMCERIKLLEEKAGRADPINCDAIRHAVTRQ